MTESDYAFFCGWLKDRTAIHLESGKQYLVETRLSPLVKQYQLGSVELLIAKLRTGGDSVLQTRVIEALVTNETSFFRDHNPFEALRKQAIPELMEARKTERRLSVWCAAASTGQEPYSLAILLRENFPQLMSWKVKILATDISREVLNKARSGVYSQLEINRGMPAVLMLKYFTQHGNQWHLNDDIRGMVDFSELNLAGSWPAMERFDLVMIRNVMIYFELETKKRILSRIGALLSPHGYLVLGGAETTYNIDDSYRRVEIHKTGFYQRR
ncbi:MAG: protein-glutamate O-methyltransferase CheR [Planctomycetia bacterium]|nr:protein-glutamate O-methyltransferase CheR [Planctomycetia bacterium]